MAEIFMGGGQKKPSALGGIAQMGGTLVGGYFGGPMGAKVGGTVGGMFGGKKPGVGDAIGLIGLSGKGDDSSNSPAAPKDAYKMDNTNGRSPFNNNQMLRTDESGGGYAQQGVDNYSYQQQNPNNYNSEYNSSQQPANYWGQVSSFLPASGQNNFQQSPFEPNQLKRRQSFLDKNRY